MIAVFWDIAVFRVPHAYPRHHDHGSKPFPAVPDVVIGR
jgi:hypothetical protein